MTCVKTGCHIYIIPYGTFAYGDAHEVAGAMFFRLVQEGDKPLFPSLHYEINNYDSWWEKTLTNSKSSVLICNSADVLSYGYEGRDIREFDHIIARISK